MVGDEVAAKVDVDESLHQLRHVGVAVVDVGFNEVWNGRGHVSKMNFPKLAHLREGSGCFINILAGVLPAFRPSAAAETDADVWRIGNFERADVTIKRAED